MTKDKQNTTLVILTESFPLGGVTEPNFIRPEVEALAAEFDRVIIAPTIDAGPVTDTLPSNVELDRSMMLSPSAATKTAYGLHPTVWRHLMADSGYIHSPEQLRAATAFSIYALLYRRRLRSFIKRHRLDPEHTLFYCFWFDYKPASLAGIRGVRFITRAHGFDIYDSESPFLSHSWREYTLQRALGCYPASDHGTAYIRTDYPQWADKVSARYLGSPEPAASATGSTTATTPDEVVILSVARVSPEKGVVRQLRCVKQWAAESPSRRIRWIHVGDGPQMERLRREAMHLPGNLTVEMPGALSNAEVHAMLSRPDITMLVMMSRSEGGRPIAISEAMSHGVPVVATGVGGVPEVIDWEVGALLSPNPDGREFARAAEHVISRRDKLSANARHRWQALLDSKTLRASWAREIRRWLP